jgi:hypothetical protein
MRGFLQPALKKTLSEIQITFAKLTRHRRSHIAKAAQTTLVKASQWARGDAVAPELATALEAQTKDLVAKKSKKK